MAAVFQPKSFPMPPVIPPSTGTPATGFPEVVFLQLSLIENYVEISSQTQKHEWQNTPKGNPNTQMFFLLLTDNYLPTPFGNKTIETIFLPTQLKLFDIKILNLLCPQKQYKFARA